MTKAIVTVTDQPTNLLLKVGTYILFVPLNMTKPKWNRRHYMSGKVTKAVGNLVYISTFSGEEYVEYSDRVKVIG